MDVVITEAGRNIAFISVGVVLLSTLVRYFTLDREKFKESQKRIKEHQAKLKDAQKKGDTKLMQKHQENLLKETMENFRHGMKPMLFTMIPILLIFGWMSSSYGKYGMAFDAVLYEVYPKGAVSVSSASGNGVILKDVDSVRWNLGNVSGGSNEVFTVKVKTSLTPDELRNQSALKLSYRTHDNKTVEFSGNEVAGGDSIISVSRREYAANSGSVDYSLRYKNNQYIVKFGSQTFGWLGWYIIISFASSIILNKLFKLT